MDKHFVLFSKTFPYLQGISCVIMGVTAILVASVQLAVAGPAVVQPPVRCLQLEPLAASGTA